MPEKLRLFLFYILLLCWPPFFAEAQQEQILIHSHNDYYQRVPFYQAYAQQVYSIEADVFIADDANILVGHDPHELLADRTLESLYIQPIVSVFEANGGRAWKDADRNLVLLIDLKTPAASTLPHIAALLSRYPHVFDAAHNPFAVQVVISGSMPAPEQFSAYPSFLWFDGRLDVEYSKEQLKRVGMVSAGFASFTKWNGKGRIVDAELEQIETAIAKAHSVGKKIRFWGTPDGITAWNTLYQLGVDIINTDRVEACASFFADFGKKQFVRGGSAQDAGIAKAERLDVLTRSFSGFDGKATSLTHPVDIYTPLAQNGIEANEVRNVILLIGDGMGLAQLQAAYAVNGGLTTFLIPTIGLQETYAQDAYTTDSAAGGSALATGQKTKNRHISVDSLGRINPSLTTYASAAGMRTGIITTGNVADATPAAFYGHAAERDDSDRLTAFLLDGRLDLLLGAGKRVLTHRRDGRNLWNELASQYRMLDELHALSGPFEKTIVLDEQYGKATTEQTIGLLAESTRLAIEQLGQHNPDGFFLMVEGAKIDYAGHAKSLGGSIMETLGFDLAVAEALKFADIDGHTLVVVTGDHETGGLMLIDGEPETGSITALYATDDHTPSMLPVFAYGPGSDSFRGVYPNTQIFHKIKALLPQAN